MLRGFTPIQPAAKEHTKTRHNLMARWQQAVARWHREQCVSTVARVVLSVSTSRLGLGHLRLVPKTNFRPNCEDHINIIYRRDDVRRRSLSRSRSFKVTNFYTNRKPICDFKVNNIKVHTCTYTTLYRLPVIAQYLSNYRLRQRDASR